MNVAPCVSGGRGTGVVLRGPGGYGLRASGACGCDARGPHGLGRAGLGIIPMCKFDLWGNAHVFWQG